MATTDNANMAYHGTTDGAAADTITMNVPAETLTIVNRAGSAELFFRMDGTAAVIGAKENWIVPKSIGSLTVQARPGSNGKTIVSIISNPAEAYSIEVTS